MEDALPAPELRDSELYSNRVALAQGTSEEREAEMHLQRPPFAFTEYNGMTERRRLTFKIKEHLNQRTDWVMMALKHNVLKTVRFEDIVEHMRRSAEEMGERKYFLVRRDHAERFRAKQMNNMVH